MITMLHCSGMAQWIHLSLSLIPSRSLFFQDRLHSKNVQYSDGLRKLLRPEWKTFSLELTPAALKSTQFFHLTMVSPTVSLLPWKALDTKLAQAGLLSLDRMLS